MAKHQVPSDTDSGSHEELSRRTFLANATLAIGGVIGLVLVVPTVGSLVPESLLRGSAASAVGGTRADVPETPLGEADAKPGKPIKVSFDFDAADGYFPSSSRTESVWAVKMTDAQAHAFKDKRPDLFENASQTLKYPSARIWDAASIGSRTSRASSAGATVRSSTARMEQSLPDPLRAVSILCRCASRTVARR